MNATSFYALLAAGMGATLWVVSKWAEESPTVTIRDARGERRLSDIDAPISKKRSDQW